MLGAVLLYMYLRRFEEEASGGPKVAVLFVTQSVDSGNALKDDAIGIRNVPQAYLEPRAIRAAARARVVGLRVPLPLKAQTSLLWTDVAIGDAANGVDIPAGMRSFNIHTAGKSASLVIGGDRIDLLATFELPGAGGLAGGLRQGTVLMQNVLVLAHGKSKSGSTQDPDSSDLSLAVSLQQAELLALAVEKGNLSVALRNRADLNFFEQISTMKSDIFLDLDPTTRRGPAGPAGPKKF